MLAQDAGPPPGAAALTASYARWLNSLIQAREGSGTCFSCAGITAEFHHGPARRRAPAHQAGADTA